MTRAFGGVTAKAVWRRPRSSGSSRRSRPELQSDRLEPSISNAPSRRRERVRGRRHSLRRAPSPMGCPVVGPETDRFLRRHRSNSPPGLIETPVKLDPAPRATEIVVSLPRRALGTIRMVASPSPARSGDPCSSVSPPSTSFPRENVAGRSRPAALRPMTSISRPPIDSDSGRLARARSRRDAAQHRVGIGREEVTASGVGSSRLLPATGGPKERGRTERLRIPRRGAMKMTPWLGMASWFLKTMASSPRAHGHGLGGRVRLCGVSSPRPKPRFDTRWRRPSASNERGDPAPTERSARRLSCDRSPELELKRASPIPEQSTTTLPAGGIFDDLDEIGLIRTDRVRPGQPRRPGPSPPHRAEGLRKKLPAGATPSVAAWDSPHLHPRRQPRIGAPSASRTLTMMLHPVQADIELGALRSERAPRRTYGITRSCSASRDARSSRASSDNRNRPSASVWGRHPASAYRAVSESDRRRPWRSHLRPGSRRRARARATRRVSLSPSARRSSIPHPQGPGAREHAVQLIGRGERHVKPRASRRRHDWRRLGTWNTNELPSRPDPPWISLAPARPRSDRRRPAPPCRGRLTRPGQTDAQRIHRRRSFRHDVDLDAARGLKDDGDRIRLLWPEGDLGDLVAERTDEERRIVR